jgi:hypothetical protein
MEGVILNLEKNKVLIFFLKSLDRSVEIPLDPVIVGVSYEEV